MKLSNWLKKSNITVKQFAHDVDVSPSLVSRYAAGKYIPTRKTMMKIVEVTNGNVTPNDFFDIPNPNNPEQEA
ncbi:MAG: helix-turn-helix transcriptional regulator [Candidatus Puniceispirillales bacterium]